MLVMERQRGQASGLKQDQTQAGTGSGGSGLPAAVDAVGEEFPGSIRVSSREFNQNLAAAKRAAADHPVIVTDRGEPAYVLMSVAEYRRLRGKGMSLWEAFARPIPGMSREDMDALAQIDVEVERFHDFPREVDFGEDAAGYERRL